MQKPARACETGQVALSDGSCKNIDMKIINELLTMVEAKKKTLESAQSKYNSLHNPACRNCPGAAAYYEMRPKLIEAHSDYRAALGFLLNAMAAMKESSAKDEVVLGAKARDASTPEFVPGKKKLRPHCEPWTANSTISAQGNICGVICRSQPSCVGFAKDPTSQWCVWFDGVESKDGDNACSAVTETEFVKNRQAGVNQKLWTAMQKVHVFDKAIAEALKVADHQSNTASKTLTAWQHFDGANKTAKLGQFDDAMDEYGGTVIDAATMRAQFLILKDTAYKLAAAEALANPPFAMPAPADDLKVTLSDVPSVGLAHTAAAKPKPLQWKDFPNSQDTEWSKLHPDCPMGAPCFCDCKCRGPPPQNFVDPGLPAPPCPPPPALPNPFMLSPVSR
jgi:hypothetical protein